MVRQRADILVTLQLVHIKFYRTVVLNVDILNECYRSLFSRKVYSWRCSNNRKRHYI